MNIMNNYDFEEEYYDNQFPFELKYVKIYTNGKLNNLINKQLTKYKGEIIDSFELNRNKNELYISIIDYDKAFTFKNLKEILTTKEIACAFWYSFKESKEAAYNVLFSLKLKNAIRIYKYEEYNEVILKFDYNENKYYGVVDIPENLNSNCINTVFNII